MRHQVPPSKTPSARKRFHTNFHYSGVPALSGTLYNTAAKLWLNTPLTALSGERDCFQLEASPLLASIHSARKYHQSHPASDPGTYNSNPPTRYTDVTVA